MTAILTILTATWNRRELLPRLYASLEAQTGYHDNFEWVVVDDGSTDESASYLADIARKAPFEMRVVLQTNGGKHRALNRGIQKVRTPWLLIVDSDDWMLSDGMANALSDIETLAASPEVTSIIAPLQFNDSAIRELPQQARKILSYSEWMSIRDGDKSILMRSTLLREFEFPSFPDETFIAESALYARAFRNGGIILSDKSLVAAEYQSGGLSDRSLALRMKNPLGCMYTYRAQLNAAVKGLRWLKAQANYHRFFWHGLLAGKAPRRNGFRANRIWLALTSPLVLRDRLITARLWTD